MIIKIAAAQYPITEHKTFADWRAHTEGWVQQAAVQGAQVLLFPEYGSMELVSLFEAEIRADIRRQVLELEQLRGDFCTVFADLARKYNTIIVAPSMPVTEGGGIFNRAYVFSNRGLVGHQDKFFMTRFENEEWGIHSANTKKLAVFEADWGSFGIQICYDVEFPIGSQMLCGAGASVILAPSCTETIRGATRVHVGARARALENQCYTVVSQTVGNAVWSPAVDINYGFAAFYSTPDKNMPEEGILSQNTPQTEGWFFEVLDLKKLEEVRQDGHVFNYKDMQNLNFTFHEEPIFMTKYYV